jgi:hypothetical protein
MGPRAFENTHEPIHGALETRPVFRRFSKALGPIPLAIKIEASFNFLNNDLAIGN